MLNACASVTSPTGGPKDEQPPKLIASTPADQTLNFKGDKIVLEFDEYVELNNPNTQILVTPRLTEDFEAIISKRSVIIEFKENLQDSTTYSFTFREAIRDITERNPARDLKLAFSTGPYIDSARIQGQVIDHLTQLPVKDAIVGLYFADDTLNIFNSPPSYLTYTNKDGDFLLENIKQDVYELYALVDKKKNGTLDVQNESHGFLPEPITVKTDSTTITIPLVVNDLREFKLTSDRPSGRYYQVRYNRGVKSYSTDKEDTLIASISKDEPNILLFYNTIQQDSLLSMLTVTDSIGQTRTDSIWIKFAESQRSPFEYKTDLQLAEFPLSKPKIKGEIKFNKPSEIYRSDSIYLQIDTLMTIPIPKDSNMQWSNRNQKLEFEISIDSLITDSTSFRNWKIAVGDSAFFNIEDGYSLPMNRNLAYFQEEDRGIIQIKVNTQYPKYKIQLISEKYTVIEEVENIKEYSFKNIKPATYLIRVLIDENEDGEWSKGNINTKTPPEPIFYYTNSEDQREIPIRSNFIIGPLELEF